MVWLILKASDKRIKATEDPNQDDVRRRHAINRGDMPAADIDLQIGGSGTVRQCPVTRIPREKERYLALMAKLIMKKHRRTDRSRTGKKRLDQRCSDHTRSQLERIPDLISAELAQETDYNRVHAVLAKTLKTASKKPRKIETLNHIQRIHRLHPPTQTFIPFFFEWADSHRVLSNKGSSKPGRWRTNRALYVREVMDCLSSSVVSSIVLMFSAPSPENQSEVGLNWRLHHRPCRSDTGCLTSAGSAQALGTSKTFANAHERHQRLNRYSSAKRTRDASNSEDA